MGLVVVVAIASLSDGSTANREGLAAEERNLTEEACSGGGLSVNDKSKSLIRDHACVHMVNEFAICLELVGCP